MEPIHWHSHMFLLSSKIKIKKLFCHTFSSYHFLLYFSSLALPVHTHCFHVSWLIHSSYHPNKASISLSSSLMEMPLRSVKSSRELHPSFSLCDTWTKTSLWRHSFSAFVILHPLWLSLPPWQCLLCVLYNSLVLPYLATKRGCVPGMNLSLLFLPHPSSQEMSGVFIRSMSSAHADSHFEWHVSKHLFHFS